MNSTVLTQRVIETQASCRTDVTHEMSKFTQDEASGIRCLPHRWQRNVDALAITSEVYEYVRVQYKNTSTNFQEMLTSQRYLSIEKSQLLTCHAYDAAILNV